MGTELMQHQDVASFSSKTIFFLTGFPSLMLPFSGLKDNVFFWSKVLWIWFLPLAVHSKGDQPWVFFGRNDPEAETPVLWPPDAKSWLIGKDSDAGRDWGQEEKGTTADEMAGWHHRLDGCEFEWTPGDGDGQGGLACCNSWGHKESDTIERLNWTSNQKCPTVHAYIILHAI